MRTKSMLATIFDEVLYRSLVLAVDRTADVCCLLPSRITAQLGAVCISTMYIILELQRNLHRSSVTNTPYQKREICPGDFEVFQKKKKGHFTHLPMLSKYGKITL